MMSFPHALPLFYPFCLYASLSANLYAIDWNAEIAEKIVNAAQAQIHQTTTYDNRYIPIPYPMGDVPIEGGVCSDVIIRAYRTALNIDLQTLVHQDMKRHFQRYPNIWGLKRPDPHIDHRRVLNLKVFFQRHGANLPITDKPTDYQAGDLVTWTIPPNLPHIGIVSHQKSPTGTPLIIHNIGAGTQLEDQLFTYPITGHYRYYPPQK